MNNETMCPCCNGVRQHRRTGPRDAGVSLYRQCWLCYGTGTVPADVITTWDRKTARLAAQKIELALDKTSGGETNK